ncbi:MAG TPA: hypothetical protein PKI91_14415 [Smithella sp.]|nr:hypothetical protein [Smithella sp.]HOE80612.1 hypothetical protein [Smithellaceae bacterium]HPL68224.1 hypothetical protein [Smithellaceae bacterium]
MEDKISLMDRLKFWLFVKLGASMWEYTIFHADYWKRPYGITFTSTKDWLKKVKEDMVDVEDLDVATSQSK